MHKLLNVKQSTNLTDANDGLLVTRIYFRDLRTRIMSRLWFFVPRTTRPWENRHKSILFRMKILKIFKEYEKIERFTLERGITNRYWATL